MENHEQLSSEELRIKNENERTRAHEESQKSLLNRLELKDQFLATDLERRIGAYKEMLEPQVRDAIATLVEKGYVTIDSGYDPRRVSEGIQYMGFKKGMINESFLPLITEKISARLISAELKSGERSDYLRLTPQHFHTVEEWKEIWNEAVSVFPERGEPAPIRERFIDKLGH